MEKFIPMVVVALAFFYQAYTNFKKEQQKARKRNPKQPVLKRPEGVGSMEKTGKSVAKPAYSQPEAQVQQNVSSIPFGEHSGPLTEEELARKKRKDRQLAERSKQADIIAQKLKEERLNEAEVFDLRDAVIKAAILERPYK